MEIKIGESFKPVTITLQSQAELNVFYQVGNFNEQVAEVIKKDIEINKDEIKEILLQLYRDL